MLNSFPGNSVSKSGGTILKSQLFTSSGTWTKSPKMVGDDVWITAIGGGGSGSCDTTARGSGDGGGFCYKRAIDVSATGSESITIGAGGAGVTGSTQDGNSGGVTSFGALLSVSGGYKGLVSNTTDYSAQYTGGARGQYFAQDNPCPVGGNGGVNNSTSASSGGGGGLILDDSGTTGGHSNNTSVPTGGTGYGAGGGASRATGTASGAGADGALLIEWMERI